MSDTSRRVVISCAVLSAAIILCLGVIAVAGIAIFTFYPPAASQLEAVPSPETSITPDMGSQSPVPSPTQPDLLPEEPQPGETPGEPPPAAVLPREITQQMDEIQSQVVDLRGLQELEPVERFLLTPQELRTRVIDDFLEDYTLEEASDDALIWSVFGLLEPDFDLYNFYVELLTEQIVGFYDSETKEMYVIQGTGFNGSERLTYAHEYVHALQDQHYQIEEGLGYNDEDCEQNIDYCAAISSLLEGDASLSEMQWLYSHATARDIQELQDFLQDYESPYFDAAPSFLREDFIFPYRAGQVFVEAIYEQGGWQAIDQVYANPPLSTEQILHPDRYPDVVPVTVELPDLLSLLGEGWRELESGLWGEWYTYLILAEGLDEGTRTSPEEAQTAADGWAGDAYRVYFNDNTGQQVLVLKTVWKNESEAVEFAEALQRYANIRFGSQTSTGDSSWRWETSQALSLLEREQEVTTWVISPPGDILDQIEAELAIP